MLLCQNSGWLYTCNVGEVTTKMLTYYWHFFAALMKNDGNDIKLRLYKGCHHFQIFIKAQKNWNF